MKKKKSSRFRMANRLGKHYQKQTSGITSALDKKTGEIKQRQNRAGRRRRAAIMRHMGKVA